MHERVFEYDSYQDDEPVTAVSPTLVGKEMTVAGLCIHADHWHLRLHASKGRVLA